MQNKHSQNGFSNLIVVLVLVIIIAAVGILLYSAKTAFKPAEQPADQSKATYQTKKTGTDSAVGETSINNSAVDQVVSSDSVISPQTLTAEFNSSAIVSGIKDFASLRQCLGDAALDCQAAALKKLGASASAVDFYRQSDWGFMANYVGYGNAQSGNYALLEIESPLAANSNRQFAFLVGKNLYYLMYTDFKKVATNNIFTEEFSSGKEISFSNGEFIGLNKKGEIVFTFDITSGCRACSTGYRAAISYSIDPAASQVAARLLTICNTPDSPDDHSPMCSSDAILNF
jgi:hypothetical protein